MNGQGVLDKIKAIKTTCQDDYLLDKSKGTITCTAIGGAMGLLLAHNHKMNLVMGAIIGGVAGGMISSYYVNKI